MKDDDRVQSLPPGFQDLDEYVDPWATELDWQRLRLRTKLSEGEIRKVYEALISRLEDIIVHLNGFSLSDLPPEERRLYNLARSCVELAHLVERLSRPNKVEIYDFDRVEPLLDVSAPK